MLRVEGREEDEGMKQNCGKKEGRIEMRGGRGENRREKRKRGEQMREGRRRERERERGKNRSW